MFLEDRTVPSTVSVSIIQQPAENSSGGIDAIVRFTRDGDLGDNLTAQFSVTGTADSEWDYSNDLTAVAFATNSATADHHITILDDSVPDPGETIVVTVLGGMDYDVGGSPATMTIVDDETPTLSFATTDTTEGSSTPGKVRITRSGATSNSLTVSYSIGGTATNGTDYTTISTSVTIAANAAYADVAIAATTDLIYDPDETVILTFSASSSYQLPGAASTATATATIQDNIDTVSALIHQETFVLAVSGSSETVSVALMVTYNAPGAPGVYMWQYVVTNPSTNSSYWTHFSVPVEDMDTDIGGLASSNGWTGTIGSNDVSWAAGSQSRRATAPRSLSRRIRAASGPIQYRLARSAALWWPTYRRPRRRAGWLIGPRPQWYLKVLSRTIHANST